MARAIRGFFEGRMHLPGSFGIDSRSALYGRNGAPCPRYWGNWRVIVWKYRLGRNVPVRFDSCVFSRGYAFTSTVRYRPTHRILRTQRSDGADRWGKLAHDCLAISITSVGAWEAIRVFFVLRKHIRKKCGRNHRELFYERKGDTQPGDVENCLEILYSSEGSGEARFARAL